MSAPDRPALTATHIESSELNSSGQLGELLALAGLLVICAIAAGGPGIVVGLLVAVVWYGFGTPYAIAIGHFGLVPVGLRGNDATLLAVWAGFLVLLLAPTVRSHTPVAFVLATVGAIGVLGGAAVIGLSVDSLPIAAGLVVGSLTVTAYALYRYELVALGRVDDSTVDTDDQQHHE